MNYEFRPKPFSSALAILASLILIGLGTWQMLRFFEKSTEEDAWTERRTAEPVQVRAVGDLDPTEEQHMAIVHGTVDTSRSAIILHKRYLGKNGCWLLNPLELADGGEVVVIRGFLPVSTPPKCDPAVASAIAGDSFRALIHTPDQFSQAASPRPTGDDAIFESLHVERAYELFGSSRRPAGNTVVVLHKDHSGAPFPAASFEHVTAPYLTSMRHLNYAGTWYFCLLIVAMMWGYRSIDRAREAEPAT